MKVLRTKSDLRKAREEVRERGASVGFVPTMGALHVGHLSLVERAKEAADVVAASVFVNPTQFDDPADLARYPRTEAEDLEQLEAAGVDWALLPDAAEVYPADQPDVQVAVPALAGRLEGAHRPGHFDGVCRVVLKLFNLVQPDVAVFGAKDFQQLRIIEAMVDGLDLPIRIIRGPTVREPDGLAMSSRNRRLSAEDRVKAVALSRALLSAEGSPREVEASVRVQLGSAGLDVEYAEVVDERTLEPATALPARLLAAVRVGGVRLIDNVPLVRP
ncbi:MAG: pantoate--beta-alanine ligase [Planctomycetota bacterium]